ncbi:Inner membrane transport protein YajR [Gammaproteobacteria bacterium]
MSTDSPLALSATERRAVFPLASIVVLRMLGLFLILPVFALYAKQLQGATPGTVGLAMGIYGLTQALLQIPAGILSDRIGRKPVIAAGLLIFALGSLIAAVSTTIEGVIIGRALQGAGAISAAVLALVADLTREEHRTLAMAVIGLSIGLSFSVALVLGPLLNGWIGVPGIFWLTAGLALLGVALLFGRVPSPPVHHHRDTEPTPGQFAAVIRDPALWRLNVSIFLLHLSVTALFMVFPLLLREVGLPSEAHWQVYLPVLLLSVLGMAPFILVSEKYRRIKEVFLTATALLGIAQITLFLSHGDWVTLVIGLWLYFLGFNILEASLPSLVSKFVDPEAKGTAMGFYSTAQFLGAFAGGLMGGLLQGHFGHASPFLAGALMTLLWGWVIWGLPAPRYLTNHLLRVGPLDTAGASDLSQRLLALPGVVQAHVVREDEVAYLKLEAKTVDWNALAAFSVAEIAPETP